MIPPTPRELTDRIQAQGHVLFVGPMNLNLVGIRERPEQSKLNAFDDLIGMVFQDMTGAWTTRLYAGTTEPGRRWLLEPGRKAGTMVLLPGQHRGCWTFGLHHGEYPAFVQVAPMRFTRDADKDEIPENEGNVYEEIVGCNLHRASEAGTSIRVDSWSAGCQVTQPKGSLDQFLLLARESAKRYGSRFSYTLLDEWR
jgi:hypothetical protein